jgi:hypothetical protein
VLAVVAVVLSKGWLRTFVFGFSEPAAIAFMFLALDRHVAGRHRAALLAGGLVALARPEAFALLAVYGGILLLRWRRSPFDWVLVGSVMLAVPALWLVPDWISTGDPFHSSERASEVWDRGNHDLARTLTIAAAPLYLTAVAGALIRLRQGDAALAGIVAFAFGWIALLVVGRLLGYPASPRYFVVPEAVVCVAGAAGAAVVIESMPTAALRVAAAAVAVACLWLWFGPQVEFSSRLVEGSQTLARVQSELATAITRAGGSDLRRCGDPRLPYRAGWARGVVAWGVHVHSKEVSRVEVARGQEFVQRVRHGRNPPPGMRVARVRNQREPAVLFLPIADLPARLMGPHSIPVPRLASYRRWAVLAIGAPCAAGLRAHG